MVKKALLVGINYYNVPGARLNGCINDITNMKNTLIANYGYNENDIIMLRDDSNAYRQPTARNIVGWLYALMMVSRQCEEVWFHYSGHGSRIRDTNGDEQSGLDSVIIPVDFQRSGIITDDLILRIINYSKCRTMLLFDSCNSGSMCDLKWNFDYNKEINTSLDIYTRSQINNFSILNPNIYCFSGCKDTQTSADIYDTVDKQYEGAFTDCFLLALKANNYSAPLLKLYKDTCDFLSLRGYSQKPQLSTSSPIINYSIQQNTPKSKMLFGIEGGFHTYSSNIEEKLSKNIDNSINTKSVSNPTTKPMLMLNYENHTNDRYIKKDFKPIKKLSLLL